MGSHKWSVLVVVVLVLSVIAVAIFEGKKPGLQNQQEVVVQPGFTPSPFQPIPTTPAPTPTMTVVEIEAQRVSSKVDRARDFVFGAVKTPLPWLKLEVSCIGQEADFPFWLLSEGPITVGLGGYRGEVNFQYWASRGGAVKHWAKIDSWEYNPGDDSVSVFVSYYPMVTVHSYAGSATLVSFGEKPLVYRYQWDSAMGVVRQNGTTDDPNDPAINEAAGMVFNITSFKVRIVVEEADGGPVLTRAECLN